MCLKIFVIVTKVINGGDCCQVINGGESQASSQALGNDRRKRERVQISVFLKHYLKVIEVFAKIIENVFPPEICEHSIDIAGSSSVNLEKFHFVTAKGSITFLSKNK